MLGVHVPVTVLCLLVFASGCDRQVAPDHNISVVELRRALYTYMVGPGHEPIDGRENSVRILLLLKTIEPLDCPEKINVALDVFEYYDATDNDASGYAGEILVKYGKATLPFVRDRLKLALNPGEIRALIREIEGS